MLGGLLGGQCGPIGFDIGAVGLRVLQLRTASSGLRVVGAAMLPRTPGGSGLPSADRLESLLAHAGFRGRRCVLSLPREVVRLQSVRLPAMSDDELREAARWEAAERFGLDRQGLEADFIRTGLSAGGNEKREEIIIVAVAHDDLMPPVETLLAAGLHPVAVETGFFALTRLFSRRHRREADERDVRVILDVGHSASTLIVLRGGSIAFAKQISVGGRDLDEKVRERLDIEPESAAELRAARIARFERGTALDDSSRPADEAIHMDESVERAVFDASRGLLAEVIREVVLCLRYYNVTFRGEPPRSMIVTGGNGREPGLLEMLAEATGLPVDLDAPTATLTSLRSALHARLGRDQGPMSSWAVAAGLALRGLETSRVRRGADAAAAAQMRRGAA
ncbi:MAG: pilus assembly protein PilM [Phycisphaeraceae bacterium]|nr:pilus assembly protein PilM [Phycisphaeraceae bacterium]